MMPVQVRSPKSGPSIGMPYKPIKPFDVPAPNS